MQLRITNEIIPDYVCGSSSQGQGSSSETHRGETEGEGKAVWSWGEVGVTRPGRGARRDKGRVLPAQLTL